MDASYSVFHTAGVVFRFSAETILVLSIVYAIVPRFRPWFSRISPPFAYAVIGTTLACLFTYVCEAKTALYGGNPYERYLFIRNRLAGPYWWAYWTSVASTLAPNLFWLRRMRTRPIPCFLIAFFSLWDLWLSVASLLMIHFFGHAF
jgi:molybdopterin-containing oxidoreductase family membrane subunit